MSDPVLKIEVTIVVASANHTERVLITKQDDETLAEFTARIRQRIDRAVMRDAIKF